ncbi:uncharacterized protein J4E79_004858 [Alternaria viburni]|uniref:uncharacterized protein n=1 Tax=Alternaria viburni TaxID=566460 RepID=UPI0020C39A8C|nr:uncharacterized protein J4E79_004858 [Alternaria viburni]KAI4662568.1 hypothetical protein J4E79_004858 [Alternaria viburni]
MADSSIVLITGGNTGIGYETVKALYASPQPHTILMGSRSLEKANDAISKLKDEVLESKSDVVSIQIDIKDDASIENAFQNIKSKYSHIAKLYKILFVTSGLSSLETSSSSFNSKLMNAPPPKGWPKPPSMAQTAYRSSKAGMNMMMLDWTQSLSVDGVKVFGISPGFLATGLGGMGPEMLKKWGAGDPSIGGVFIKDVVEGKRDEDSGKVINKDGVQPW